MRRALVIVLAAAVVVAGGCAERVIEPEAAELSAPTTVSAQRYLADNAGAAAALREFVAVLDEAGPTVTDADARRNAPELDRIAGEFTTLAGRIERERLEDQRLEAQRSEIAASLVPAIASVQGAALAAEQGDSASLVMAVDSLRRQLPELARVGNT